MKKIYTLYAMNDMKRLGWLDTEEDYNKVRIQMRNQLFILYPNMTHFVMREYNVDINHSGCDTNSSTKNPIYYADTLLALRNDSRTVNVPNTQHLFEIKRA